MKKVLVLTDFSDNAWNALFTALKIYETTDVLYYITNCFEPTFVGALGDKTKERLTVIYESLAANSNIQLDEVINYLAKHHDKPNHSFEKLSIEDDLVDALKDLLKKNEIDLIVMGARGATGSRDVFMGSNAVEVIRKIRNCPILAVPEKHDFKAMDRIIFPTDFSHRISASELNELKEIAKIWGSEIIVFQVSEEIELSREQTENKEALQEELLKLNHRFESTEMKVNLKTAINSVAESTKSDMIALIHYPHTFMERLTREPVVKKLAFQSKVPLMVLPERSF
ncbi:MAG: universal stress protein [Flavobacteriaceae bacterium]